MPVEVTPLPFKPPQMKGLSEKLLVSHYENNYGGAVRRLNAIDQRMAALGWATAPGFEINGLGRERLIAANSILLHEAYFEKLGGSGGPAGSIAAVLERDFGSVDHWLAEFAAMGKALGGGSGWVLLTWSDRLGRLTNQWSADHCHVLAESVPVLALDMYEHDMYEHAYSYRFWRKRCGLCRSVPGQPQLGTYRGPLPPSDRTESGRVSAREDQIGPTALRALLDRSESVLILDVCADEDRPRRYDAIPGARLGTPDEVATWIKDLPTDRLIIVTGTYGFEKSANVVTTLRGRGCDARQLAGGMAAWHALAGPTEPLTNRPGP